MPNPRLALTFILIAVALDAIGIGIIFPVLPDLIREVTGLPLSEAALWAGTLGTAFAVMQFLFGPVLGALSDRFGRRPVMLLSLGIMSADYLVMATAGTIWLLLAARIVAGITASTYATATAFIADITPPEKRGARFGLIGACFGVGFVIGPLIGAVFAGIDTRAPFFAASAMAAGNLILGWFALPETVTDATRRPFRWARANPLGALMSVTRLPGLGPTLACWLILALAMSVYPTVWAFYGQANFGWSSQMVGLSLALYGVSFAVGQAAIVGPLIRRWGEHRAARFGMAVDVLTLTALGLVTTPWIALAIIPVTALGGTVTPSLQAIASRAAPADAQGEVHGVLSSLNAVATVAAPLLMTTTFAHFTREGAPLHAPGAPFLLSAALMLGCLLLFSLAARRPRPFPA